MRNGLTGAWVGLAVGAALILGALVTIYVGRIRTVWWRYSWLPSAYSIDRAANPVLFWLRVLPQFVVGVAFVVYGVVKLLG